MQTTGPTSGIPAPAVRTVTQSSTPPLQVGQLLQATVLENSAGKLLLALGHRQIAADSSLPARPGDVLTLEVRSLGEQPVLRLIAALQASASADAVRMLLPRYGPTTPLLATLPQLAQAPAGSLPAPLAEAVRTLLRQLPERASLSSADGVRTAIARSGSFTEQQLLRHAGGEALQGDFKANLLRLLAQLRALPEYANAQPPNRASGAAPPTAAATAQPSPASQPRPSGEPPPAAADRPQSPPPSPTSSPQAQNASAPLPAARDALAATVRAATTPPPGTTPGTPPAGQPTAPTPSSAVAQPPPPFAGAMPVPQSPVQAVVDLLKGLTHLRPELLQQTEAALARIHLNQLASLPRDGDHRLVEWLFDIPVRRGDAIDLWSVRLQRDAERQSDARQAAAAVWRVQLAFDLPGLGPMQAHVTLQGECISTRFHAERPETLPLVDSHLPELRRALLEAGLEVGTLDCHAGIVPCNDAVPRETLIDEQA